MNVANCAKVQIFLLIREGQNYMNAVEFLGNTDSGSEGLFVLSLASPFFKLTPNLCVSCLIAKLLKAGCTLVQALDEDVCFQHCNSLSKLPERSSMSLATNSEWR